MSNRWVINASPIILLSKAGVIDLLSKICSELVIPSGVVSEVSVGQRGDAGRAWLAGEGSRFIVPSPPISDRLNEADLGLGEAEVLSWALLHDGFAVVLDDARGRLWAKRLDLPLLGSLGAVVVMKRRGLLPYAKPILEKVRSAGAYVSESAFRAAVIEAGET